MKLTLALLSGGSAVGQNILSALAHWRDRLRLVATSSIAEEPALFEFDSVRLVPGTVADAAGFDRCVVNLIAAESPDLVVPCRDDDVHYLASLAQREPALAPRLLCGNAAAAEIVTDKWRSHEFCVARGLPYAPTLSRAAIASRAPFVREQGFPLVAKPRHGCASRDVLLLWNDAQLDRALARDDHVVQRFLGSRRALDEYFASIDTHGVPLLHSFMGEKHSIQALIGPEGDVREVMVTRNWKTLRSRSVVPDTTPSTVELGRRCAEALAQAGWRGLLNIQCQKDDDGTLWIHEFNGRFTGITADRALLGYNEVTAAVAAFTGFTLGAAHDRPVAATVSLASLVSRAPDPRLVRLLACEGMWRRAT
jgi:carbamoylphosphate synthase large subunit